MNRTPASHRCLLTFDRRFGAAALSPSGTNGADYTQAGPLPGVPVASSGAPEMQASGEQGNRTVDVYTVRGGNPGARVAMVGDGYETGPGVAWRYVDDALYRGWDPPDTISEIEFIERGTAGADWLYPHAVSQPDGRMFLVSQEAERYVRVHTRPRAGVWVATATRPYDAGSAVYASPIRACPCLVVLPGNRLLCLFWRYDATTPAIHSTISTDNGATWGPTQLVEAQLTANALSPYRIRAAYSNGQILMLASCNTGAIDRVVQFASIDDGASFTLAAVIGENDCGYAEVVAAPGGGFIVAVIETDSAYDTAGSSVVAYARRVSSAFDVVLAIAPVAMQAGASTVRWGTKAGAGPSAWDLSAGDLALCVDAAGVLWATGTDFAAGGLGESYTTRSRDGGATWAILSPTGSGGAWWRGLDAATHPRELTSCTQGARVVVVSLHSANPGVSDDSLIAWYLGGPTTVCQPQGTAESPIAEYMRSFTVTYAPLDLPENTGATWTAGGAGAPTISLTGQGLRVQHTGAADAATWTATPVTTDAQGLYVLVDIRAVVDVASITLTIHTGGLGYTARIDVSPTQIALVNVGGGANLKVLATTAGATGVQIKLAIGDDGTGGKARAWYRAWGSDSDREFIAVRGISDVLTQYAVAADAIVFGTTAGVATTDVYFRLVQYAQGADCGTGLYLTANLANPGDLLGQPIGPAPYPLAETGLRLAMVDGPTRAGDTWTIAPRYAHPIANIDPATAPSPAATYRNLVHNVSQRIVWTLPEATPAESPLFALHVVANFATADWCGWNGAAWVVLGTIDFRMGTTLKYTRAGEIVYCGTGGGSPIADYVEKNALAGCRMLLAAGVIRKIRTNSGGRWTGAAVTTTRPIVVLDAPVVGDPAAGVAAEMWSSRATMILRGQSTAYSRYSLHIPAQVTAEGYYEIGVCMPGPLTVLGSPDWARQLSTETNVETTETRSGSRRKRRLGLPRRTAQVAWTEGVDSSNCHDSEPDYVTDYTGGWQIATPAALASDMHGIVYVNDVLPVVYLPVVPVPAAAATVTCITAADLALYATIESDVIQTDVVLGQEHTGLGAGELGRVGTVRIEEVL